MRKWIKEGVLKPTTVSNFSGGVHYELFMIEDNKDILPPKEMVKSHSVKETKDGKESYSMHPWYHFVDPKEHLKGYKIMDYLRIVPPEEVKAREEAEKKKWEEKRARRKIKSMKKKKI